MSEFLQDYGFFILIAAFLLLCHLGHGGHGRGRRDDEGGPQDRGGRRH